MDISSLTTTELKALAYDEVAKIQAAQQNLGLINQKLAQLAQASEVPNVPA